MQHHTGNTDKTADEVQVLCSTFCTSVTFRKCLHPLFLLIQMREKSHEIIDLQMYYLPCFKNTW